ncbi:MAG: hypothetical protein HY680_00985 [Chloroflexi bacterium]|nr:hypothetical protein [Chloroflexota bacterium]
MSLISGFGSRFKRYWLSAVLFLIPLILYVFGPLVLQIADLYLHLLLTLTAVMGVHVLDRLFLAMHSEQALDHLIKTVRCDIGEQTRSLVQTSKSLVAMDRSGIEQVYSGRDEAAVDITRDLTNADNSQIRLIGISLNDFVMGMDVNLVKVWSQIQDYIAGAKAIAHPDRGLDIRVLIIDPACFGAKLREEAEKRQQGGPVVHLTQDVEGAARALYRLESTAADKSKTTHVTLECRLYRLPPLLFLCWTDSVCYVQQYHFWSRRDNRTPMPVLKFLKSDVSDTAYPYHDEMKQHFEWIWENASISVADYLEHSVVGTDEGLNQCGTVNIYTNPKTAHDRMVHLLQKAKDKVSIQGISLSSFFTPGELFSALYSLVRNENVDIEILLLDPDCEQARYRSYREQLFAHPNEVYDEYIDGKGHEGSVLYQDTMRTISTIKGIVQQFANEGGWRGKIKVRLYKSAPACFVLRVDDHVLVEQYHYGKIIGQVPAILGKDMPLVEYCKDPTPLFRSNANRLRSPFGLLVNHLDFALKSMVVDLLSTDPNKPKL